MVIIVVVIAPVLGGMRLGGGDNWKTGERLGERLAGGG